LSYAGRIWAVVLKDARSEYRAMYALNSILLFCLTSLAVVSFSTGGSVSDTRLQSALLWIIIFFSAMVGLSRAFVKEEDRGTMNTLRLACDPAQVFIGKSLVNLLLLAVVMAVVTPFFVILLNVTLRHVGWFALVMLFAGVGLSAVCTLLSAVVAQARARGALFAALVFPIMFPMMMVAVKATESALLEPSPWAGGNQLVFLACYAVASAVGGAFLFEFVFSE
jgi:heme exporter protein B